MLVCALEQHSCSQRIDIRSYSGCTMYIITAIVFVQSTSTKIHASHGIADKWMQTAIEGLIITATLTEV